MKRMIDFFQAFSEHPGIAELREAVLALEARIDALPAQKVETPTLPETDPDKTDTSNSELGDGSEEE